MDYEGVLCKSILQNTKTGTALEINGTSLKDKSKDSIDNGVICIMFC